MRSWTGLMNFILMQLLAATLGICVPFLNMGLPGEVMWLACVPVGTFLGGVAFCRKERNGITRAEFIGAAIVTSIEWLLVWTVVAIGLLIAVHGAGDGVMFILFWVQMTVLFSVGCQAYYGVGRFRPRLRFIPRARRLLDTKCDFTIGRPALPAQLERAEQLLGLHLPRSYQEFLTSFGELRAPALKILGITQRTDLEHPTLEDCVGATLVGREHYQVPQGYLVCGVDRDGNLLCLDTVAMAYQEGAVVSWRTQTRAYGDWLAMSFGAYLMRELASVPTMPIF